MAEKQLVWTTWEELLLACAVKRHGVKDWESVAMELQTRSSLPLRMTAQICKNKYHDLKRRFTETTDHDNGVDNIPWLEELRKLRVAELKQEVHRYDLSIQSLQLKVKRLEEERERSVKESENDDEKPDLVKDLEDRSENEREDGAGFLVIAGEGFDRENRSFNESNSAENRKSAANEERMQRERVQPGHVKPDPASSDSKPSGEDSYNDSSDTVAKQAAARQSQKKGGCRTELRDSAGESKEGTKESSDVQSTASLTRKRRRTRESSGWRGGGGGGGDEPVLSPATIKREAVKSEPLVRLLDIIRSHKHGSMFKHRLESQKTNEYKNTVRHHVDLETIWERLDEGSYSCTAIFYRDLLLLFNNALVFFPKGSTESTVANELRDLVSKELNQRTQRSDSSQEPAPSKPSPLQPKPDPERSGSESLLTKHESLAPIMVCRKRSSIPGRSPNAVNDAAEKQKLSVNASSPPLKACSNADEEESLTKVKTKERPVTGTRSLRRSSNVRTSPAAHKGEAPNKTEAGVKKQRAADFLKRIKGNTSTAAKGETPPNTAKSKGGGGRKREGWKERPVGTKRRGSSRSGGGRRMKEESSPLKRSVGRPPKEGREAGGATRGRDGDESEAAAKRAKKGSKR